jgi:hypothetical protein
MPKRLPDQKTVATAPRRGWLAATAWELGLASIDDRTCEALDRESLSTPSAAPPSAPVPATAPAVATSPADDELLTLKQAATARGVGEELIKSAIRSGALEGEYPQRDGGRGYRVRRGKLMAWHPPPRRGKKPAPPTVPKRAIVTDDQPPELLALGLRFEKDGV